MDALVLMLLIVLLETPHAFAQDGIYGCLEDAMCASFDKRRVSQKSLFEIHSVQQW